ncbi:MAG: ATP-binding protein [Desulfocapsaceae bacterium]|nr:ATP-binding protein [Desulfocapsaceae bacterium]
MRGIFFKLFLSFWLIMLLGGAMSVVAVSTFRHLSIESLKTDMARKNDENLARLIVLSGQAAWEMFTCGGSEEYESYIDGLAAGARIRLTLIRDDNRTITGGEIDSESEKLADSARIAPQASLLKTAEGLTVAKRLTARDGGSVVVVGVQTFGPPPGQPPPPPPDAGGFHFHGGPPLGPPLPFGEERHLYARFFPPFLGRGEIIRSAIMLIVVSGVCYVLARSLATPIRRLQVIAQRIAEGDYSARVGTVMGGAGSELAALGRDFDIMVERTEKVIAAQKRLLRDISHELRSPLARLNVALELAKKQLHAEENISLRKIGQESARLNDLIGQLLILARLESGSGLPAVERVNLAGLIREVAADANFEASSMGRGVEILSVQEIGVSGSRELLRRAIENIVRNAVQYTARNTRVQISLSLEARRAEIRVVDFGAGVPEQDLLHLFEPFYRVAKARERQTGGTGIGLAIAEQAVKAHGGRIAALNGEGQKGLIVIIVLPVCEDQD